MNVQRALAQLSKIMDKQFTINLSEQELNIVLTGLNELPIKVGMQTLQKVVQQAQEQVNKVPEGPLSDKVVKAE